MKIIGKKSLLFSATLALAVVSCKSDFLEIKPTGQLSEESLAGSSGVEGTLVAAYTLLSGAGYSRLSGGNNWVFGSINGGDANKGTNAGDYSSINSIQRYESLPGNGDIAATWQAKYEGISRCNSTLRLLAAAKDITDANKKRISGEARFLRGHYYFELRKIFGNVPYIDETLDYGKGIEKVANNAEIWAKIEADFKYAADNLPETQGAAGRSNKWAAVSYLGKTFLFQKKYAEAKAQFDLVIASGKTTNGKKYNLVPSYSQIFNATNDNHEESIFAVQSAVNTGSTNNANWFDDLNYPYNTGPSGPGNCCGFFQPSLELGNSFRTDAKGLPLLDGTYNDKGKALTTDQGLLSSAAFTPDAGTVDPRLDHSIGRRGLPYLDWQDHPGFDWIRDQSYAGPYSPKKYIYYKSQEGSLTDGTSWTRGYAAMNYTIIRYADVLLMAAEAEVEVGSLAKAQEYVNLVRKRASNPATFVAKAGKPAANYVIGLYETPWADKDAARTAVRFERKLELSGEGHRFFDLVRWGTAEKTLNAYLAYEGKTLTTALGGAKYTTANDEYQPIPQSQIDLQGAGVLKQNPGY
jgi:starch-binding outer membrane protein, SusD/RagB family